MLEKIFALIVKEMGVKDIFVHSTIKLLQQENTVPFIARYRKEVTGGLDETEIREIERKLKYYTLLDERKNTILESIKSQNKLTDELEKKITECLVLSELEDIYLPYKPKKKTRASVAKEKGLEPLAEKIMESENPADFANDFINLSLGVGSVDEALQGAMDIVAEIIAEDFEIRSFMRKISSSLAILETKEKELKPESEVEMYKDYKEPVGQLKSHRILAINRAERTGEISVKIVFPETEILQNIQNYFITHENPYIYKAIEDSYKRLLKPSIEREIRHELTESAENQAITVFSKNLSQLLLQPPLKGRVILGIDPGIRTGCKFAIIDAYGEVLNHGVFDQKNPLESAKIIGALVIKYKVQLIAIGNGTGSREVEKIVSTLLSSGSYNAKYAVVPETGASVYSASEIAREEFPELDVTIRGAISIARRLQDPISEYVKIDPKSLGVGQYQHDVDQSLLGEELDKVVEDCVNKVGVNINTSSHELLKYVSGLSPTLARKIVLYRKLNGRFNTRFDIKNIKGLGEKSFEQCAGFLKIPDSSQFLDNTWVHPENYPIAEKILLHKNAAGNITLTRDVVEELKSGFNVSENTIKQIIRDIEKPNLDPRDELDKPILKENIMTIDNLENGMILKGTVRNIVDFGAFVDIGIKNDGLVHISEIADRYIKHPLEVLEIGNVVDVMIIDIDKSKERVKLSIKKAKESLENANN